MLAHNQPRFERRGPVAELILVVDDEESIRELIRFNLEKEGYTAVMAEDGPEALEIFRVNQPDLVLLDIMLPTMDGWEVCKAIRKESNTPIIMLTAKGDESERVSGLEMGADDYITKPFSPKELMARIKAVLRRAYPMEETTQVRLDELVIDIDRHEVTESGRPIALTPKEFELLLLLVKNQGKVLSRDMLLETVWGYDYGGETRTVDVHIRRLRQKLNDDPTNPRYIHTVHGVGYKVEGRR
ncbi:MAG: response regulator transcription factor [Firmicutes bacterium]|nr:response regulator transcription factor [Bacillota bacterium]